MLIESNRVTFRWRLTLIYCAEVKGNLISVRILHYDGYKTHSFFNEESLLWWANSPSWIICARFLSVRHQV